MIDRERLQDDEAYREGVTDGLTYWTIQSVGMIANKIKYVMEDDEGDI